MELKAVEYFLESTRLHSSRMPTARVLTVSPSMLCVSRGGECTWSMGVSVPGGCSWSQGLGVSALGGIPGPVRGVLGQGWGVPGPRRDVCSRGCT